ncbi:S-adenosyl-L-methionine-dependent methyltransferase [Penicillium antarcticum]|nr:S-adenosyl-L-methionine-dependent methyltransferase [Penicillium antarcticum]KAJ5295741.1 S-adenosyl-L-methionine-dependent methyltransferase [Penicillium antarcticum]
MASPEPLQSPEGQTRLVRHFEGRSIDDHSAAWSNLWDTDNSDMWDRGKPSPALIDALEQNQDTFNPITADGRRKRALVPGCGKGYDVVMLALHGFDAYGLDVSSKGVSVAEEYAGKELQSPQPYNFGAEGTARERGNVSFIEGDFFKSKWEDGRKFDLIYDYTFLCALHPTNRREWASRMADLLLPGGLLICLEFPLFKDLSLPGPPWPLKGVYWNLLVEGGDGLVTKDRVISDSVDGSFVRNLYIKPETSYENGKGTDMLSVYAKK